jgi:hypothetical protein
MKPLYIRYQYLAVGNYSGWIEPPTRRCRMPKVKMSLTDNDYLVHASAELSNNKKEHPILDLIQHLDEDFIEGEDAFLEVIGLKNKPVKFVISQIDA